MFPRSLEPHPLKDAAKAHIRAISPTPWIELHGGIYDGMSAPEGQANPLPTLSLLHLVTTSADAWPDVYLSEYVRGTGLRYAYDGEQKLALPDPTAEVCIWTAALCEKLWTLIADPRLAAGSAPIGLASPIPLDEARRHRDVAVARHRQLLLEHRQPAHRLSTEQLWEHLRGVLQADLEWCDIGSVPHYRGIVTRVETYFDVDDDLLSAEEVWRPSA